MIAYEVTVQIEPQRADDLQRYLADTHLPEMLGTGCFTAIHLERTGGSTFRSRYECAAQGDLDRYLADFAPAMRDDFARHFPSDASVSRTVWTHVRDFRP